MKMVNTMKFSMASFANDYECPEVLLPAKDNYKPIEEVIDNYIEIMAFTFVTSTNLEKYNQNNEKAVFFMFREEDGTIARTSTHSKKVVKAFETLEKAVGNNVLEVPIPTKIVKKQLPNGRTMFDFEF